MENESKGFAFVKCCDRNQKYIYMLHANNLFYFDGVDSSFPIEYCPWCGILLDTNLLEE